MKSTLILLCAAIALGGCARGFERPTPAAPDRAISRPASAAAGASVPAGSCTWAGQATSNGGMSCQQGQQYRCDSGTWKQTALSC